MYDDVSGRRESVHTTVQGEQHVRGIARFLQESVRADSEGVRKELFRQVVVVQAECFTIATLSDELKKCMLFIAPCLVNVCETLLYQDAIEAR